MVPHEPGKSQYILVQNNTHGADGGLIYPIKTKGDNAVSSGPREHYDQHLHTLKIMTCLNHPILPDLNT